VNNKWRLLSLITVAALVSTACGTNPKHARDALYDKAPCCERYDQFRFQLLQFDQPLTVKINAGSPAYRFPVGKSHFVAAEVPGDHGRREVAVQSRVSTYMGWTEAATYLFYPVVSILDGSYRPLRSIRVPEYQVSANIKEHVLEIPLVLGEGEKFIVIYTDPTLIGKDFTYSFATSGSGGGVTFRGTAFKTVTFDAGGELELRVRRLSSN
jgi:hypothetical protein